MVRVLTVADEKRVGRTLAGRPGETGTEQIRASSRSASTKHHAASDSERSE
jgi:hypothetical protein